MKTSPWRQWLWGLEQPAPLSAIMWWVCGPIWCRWGGNDTTPDDETQTLSTIREFPQLPVPTPVQSNYQFKRLTKIPVWHHLLFCASFIKRWRSGGEITLLKPFIYSASIFSLRKLRKKNLKNINLQQAFTHFSLPEPEMTNKYETGTPLLPIGPFLWWFHSFRFNYSCKQLFQ